ncbi:MAG: adenylate/guanylate cyclase domain-containing protein [Nitrospinota bacterium]
MDVPIPENDAERVAALRTYNIMDSAPELAYDDITKLAAQICHCPIAHINMIDESRLWYKSKYGIPPEITERPRYPTICSNTICRNDLLVVPDLTKDERFSNYPLVVGEPYHRFYCGMPLINPQGYALGSICVLDFEPRELTPEQTEAIRHLASQVVAQLELRRNLIELERAHRQLSELNQTLEEKVREQVNEIARVSRFKRYLSPQIAKTILESEGDDPFKSHRREVTVVFLDLRGFTAFSDYAEPEEVIEFLRGYHTEMGKLIFQYEGTLEHFAGDGIMAFFNDPIPREDHTEMAVRMAVEMQARVKDLRTGWLKKGYDLDLGIGMAAGYATMGTIGFEGRRDYGAVGNVTILASRLSSEARGGQILTNQRTLSKIEELVEAEPRGELHIKGFARPVAVSNIVKLKG